MTMESRQPAICLVEDDAIMGESLRERLELEGYAVDWLTTIASASEAIAARTYDMLICDDRLPDGSGGDLFARLNTSVTAIPATLFITGFGSIDRAVALLKLGALDYVTKPFDIEQLLRKVEMHCQRQRTPESPHAPVSPLGVSAPMRAIDTTLKRISRYATHVVITGESGVGKEVAAKRLHELAFDGESRPFVAVNCGALSESLLESELFGHERGAFTGAVRTKRGVLEMAHGGTLFLDEISEMPLNMQVELLRVLQDREVTRVGGETVIPLDFRLTCATHRDLRAQVAEGNFREDLYYRVNVVHIEIPPLRERHEDILWLAERFLAEHNRQHPERTRGWGPTAKQSLLRHRWPGNVRELKHCIERAWVLDDTPDIEFPELAADTPDTTTTPAGTDLKTFLEGCERAHIIEVLERHGWAVGRSAEALGISRKNLWERMRRLDIDARSPPGD